MRYAAIVAVLVFLPGCMLDLLTSTAIVGELNKQNAQTATRALQHTQETTSRTQLEQAIRTYQAEKGHYPSSLSELSPNYIATVPVQPNGQSYNYDSATGQISTGAPVATGPTPNDQRKMQQIQAAVNNYGQATGYYPPSLQALVPNYLAQVPKTDSGQDFVFYPQNGALYHPAQLGQSAQGYGQQQATQGNRGGAGLGGLPGTAEAMTGIAMQNELNGMSQGGSAAASSRTRGNARELQSGRNGQVNNAMDRLGL